MCLDFQIELTSAGLTAKNSTSLQRAPGPVTDAVKGDATNYPFWPGQLHVPLCGKSYIHVLCICTI